MAAFLDVWLALPEMRAEVDPSALDPAERAAWESLRTQRRRRDWEVSRRLRQVAAAPAAARTSLSHSHGHAAYAATDRAAVGVDLECCVTRLFEALAQAAFAPEEAAHVAAGTEPADRAARFYELWVLKESCAKALARPLPDVLQATNFVACARGASPFEGLPAPADWAAWVYAPVPALRLALFVAGPAVAQARPRTHGGLAGREESWPLVRRYASDGSYAGDEHE